MWGRERSGAGGSCPFQPVGLTPGAAPCVPTTSHEHCPPVPSSILRVGRSLFSVLPGMEAADERGEQCPLGSDHGTCSPASSGLPQNCPGSWCLLTLHTAGHTPLNVRSSSLIHPVKSPFDTSSNAGFKISARNPYNKKKNFKCKIYKHCKNQKCAFVKVKY